MKRQLLGLIATLVILTALMPASSVLAVPVPSISLTYIFNFDTGSPALPTGRNTPFDQTYGGLTAHFSSTSDPAAFSVQDSSTTFLTLSQFSGKYLYQNGIISTNLKIGFNQPITNISLTFATTDLFGPGHVEIPSNLQLTAYTDSTESVIVGTAIAHGTFSADTFPQGTMSFDSGGQPFSWVKLEIIYQPLGATAFLVDNIVASMGNVIINEGDTFASSGSFGDSGPGPWTATVDYGDGSGVQPLTLSGFNFNLSHLYSDNGTFTVTVTVTDPSLASGSDTALVTVNNVAPVVNAGPDASINEGDTFSSSGSFTDPGTDTWTATVDYGDGSGVQPLTLSGKTFSLSHLYTTAGSYTVTVTVTDDDLGSGSDTTLVNVVIVIYGDVNEDGIIDALDLFAEVRIILGWEFIQTPEADANQDGNVNILDLVKIKRIILGLDY